MLRKALALTLPRKILGISRGVQVRFRAQLGQRDVNDLSNYCNQRVVENFGISETAPTLACRPTSPRTGKEESEGKGPHREAVDRWCGLQTTPARTRRIQSEPLRIAAGTRVPGIGESL